MAAGTGNLGLAVEILTIINTLAPPTVELVKTFLQKLEGKTTEEVKAEAHAIWMDVIATADAELAKTPAE